MRLTTVIEAVVILAAASVAFAAQMDDTYQRAERLVCDASAAVDGLDPRPWAPTYEQFRRSAVVMAEDAEASLGEAFGHKTRANYWYNVMKAKEASGDFAGMQNAAFHYTSECQLSVAASQQAAQSAEGAIACVRSAWAAIGK